MRNVRFSCMTLAEIIEASQVNDIIRHSSFCRNRVLEAVWLMTLKGYKTHDVFGCPCPKPRQHLQNKGPQLPVVVETINVDSLQQGQDVSNHANGLRASGNCSMLDSVEMGDFCKPVARPAYPQETSQSSFHQQRHDSFPVYQCGDASLNKPGKMPRRHQVPSSISLGMNILYPGNPVAQDNFCQSAGDGLGLDQLSTNTVRQSRSGASKAKGPGAAPASVPSKPAPSLRDGGHRQASQMSLPPMKRVSSKSSIYSDKYAPPRQSRPPSSSRMSVPDTSSGKFRDSSASKSPQSLHRQPSNSSRTTPETTKSLAYPIRNMYFGPKKSVQKVPIISVSRGTSSASIIPPPPPPPPPPPSPPPLPPPVEFEDVPSFKFFSSRLSGEGYEGDMCGVEVSFEQRAVSPSRDSQPASDLQVEPETSAGGMSGTSVEWREGDLLAVGGFVDSSNKVGSSMAHVLDSRQQKWEKLSQIPETRLNFAAAFLKNTLCICGGYDPHRNEAGTRATTDMFMFNKGDQKWVQGGNMLYARAFHAVCVLGGRLFALGGQDQDDRALKTVEVYDPEADRWSLVCSMTACRVGACATAFQGRVMVVGGYGESSDYSSEPCPVLLTTEWFEPAINRWLARGSLRLPRAQACLVAAGPYLYLCGGATRDPSSGTLCSIPDIDRYNPDTDQWIRLTNLEVARHNAGATAIGTKIYVVGGVSTDLNQVLRSVECFDTSTNRWDTSLPELPLGAKSLACIVIAG
ncbi:uncharacterized protein LOC143284483 [Babylonia areolata]|uniref:uncharacterized protein LOC143284483 n=1 Tax=Babylonia areolata TaxID=304850 RepID=UPI003FD04907